MDEATVRRCIRLYGLEPHIIHPMLSGYRNESYPVELVDGRTVNLILYKREPGMQSVIRRTNQLSLRLIEHGLMLRYPLDTRIIKVRGTLAVRYASLYNFLPGTTIPWEAYTMEHLKLLGQALAQLHVALCDYDDPAFPTVVNQYSTICSRMSDYFADPSVSAAISRKLHIQVSATTLVWLKRVLEISQTLPRQQLLHMDFVRSNILFAEQPLRITGMLDFEKAASGHPLFDIARTLAFLLVDCKYKSEEKVRKYFLTSGYQKRGQLTIERVMIKSPRGKCPLLEVLIDLFLLYDLYKFLRHNPYESLAGNEHYVRTRDLLLSRDVITTTANNLQD